MTERERPDAWMKIRRREWIRDRAENEGRAREQRARLHAGVTNARTSSPTSGGAMPPARCVWAVSRIALKPGVRSNLSLHPLQAGQESQVFWSKK
jgi:hypothetical protein